MEEFLQISLFIKEFRYVNYQKILNRGQEFLDQIKAENNQVIFVSAHFVILN